MEQVSSSSAPKKLKNLFAALWKFLVIYSTKCTSGWIGNYFSPTTWLSAFAIGHRPSEVMKMDLTKPFWSIQVLHRRSVEALLPPLFCWDSKLPTPPKNWGLLNSLPPGVYRRSALTDSRLRPWHLLRSSKNIDVDSRPLSSYSSKNQIEFRYSMCQTYQSSIFPHIYIIVISLSLTTNLWGKKRL